VLIKLPLAALLLALLIISGVISTTNDAPGFSDLTSSQKAIETGTATKIQHHLSGVQFRNC
jgi:hypothetical protein